MTTYYELISFLDGLINKPISEENVAILNSANVSLTKDRYVRFIEQVNYLLTTRLRNSMDKVIDTVCERYLEPNELILELNNIRMEIAYMQKIVCTKLIKEENQKQFMVSLVKNNNEIFEEIKRLYTDEEFIIIIDGYFIKEN